MPLPKFQVTKKKDGREVTWFRDTQGRVRISEKAKNNWTRVEQIRDLADYGILLQLAQLDAGLGSDGSPAKVLSGRYAAWKSKMGLESKRNLLGLGGRPMVTNKAGEKRRLKSATHMQGRGHMRDDIRVNYVDEQKATITISNQASRIKARANEQKSPWYGWSPSSITKLREYAHQLFGTGIAEQLFELGLIGASALSFATQKLRRATTQLRRAA
jgi:hypothetical protein